MQVTVLTGIFPRQEAATITEIGPTMDTVNGVNSRCREKDYEHCKNLTTISNPGI